MPRFTSRTCPLFPTGKFWIFVVFIWTLVLLIGEHFVFEWTIRACFQRRLDPGVPRYRFVVIADPQLTDAYSYKLNEGFVLTLVEFYSDIYMKRSFRAIRSQLPREEHVGILFLGDLMDGGREWVSSFSVSSSDSPHPNQPAISKNVIKLEQRFQQSQKRFQHVFNQNENESDVFFMGGNHDYGIGQHIVQEAKQRFRRYFPWSKLRPNSDSYHSPLVRIASHDDYEVYRIWNHTDVFCLDTLPLASREFSAKQFDQTMESLLKAMKTQQSKIESVKHRKILFTHVPLYRNPAAECTGGWSTDERPQVDSTDYQTFPLQRASSMIADDDGYQYQNILNHGVSSAILQKLRPELVFSGDDHDQCFVRHGGISPPAYEYTIGTFSWLQGNSVPTFLILDIPANPTVKPQLHLCIMPSQYVIYFVYIVLFVLTLLCIYLPLIVHVIRRQLKRYVDSWDGRNVDPTSGTDATVIFLNDSFTSAPRILSPTSPSSYMNARKLRNSSEGPSYQTRSMDDGNTFSWQPIKDDGEDTFDSRSSNWSRLAHWLDDREWQPWSFRRLANDSFQSRSWLFLRILWIEVSIYLLLLYIDYA